MKQVFFQAAKLPQSTTDIYDSPMICDFLSIFSKWLLISGRMQYQIFYQNQVTWDSKFGSSKLEENKTNNNNKQIKKIQVNWM